MSAEYEDVLTNQPVVIDNVCNQAAISPSTFFVSFGPFSLGLGNNQGRIRWSGSSEMLLPLIVRLFPFPGSRVITDGSQKCRAAKARSSDGRCS
jgi:hypothetical protein